MLGISNESKAQRGRGCRRKGVHRALGGNGMADRESELMSLVGHKTMYLYTDREAEMVRVHNTLPIARHIYVQLRLHNWEHTRIRLRECVYTCFT